MRRYFMTEDAAAIFGSVDNFYRLLAVWKAGFEVPELPVAVKDIDPEATWEDLYTRLVGDAFNRYLLVQIWSKI